MLEEIRRPIRIDDWNRMTDQFNRLEKRVNELEERIPKVEPVKEWVDLVYNRFFKSPNDFFREECMYTFPFQITEEIEDRQDFGLLKNVYIFDKEMLYDIDKHLAEGKCIRLIVNINELEINQKKVEIKENTVKVEDEPKPKKKGRPKKKKGWFGL